MAHIIQTASSNIQELHYSPEADLHSWLSEQMQLHKLRWLLAYADDGVIWGELRDGSLHSAPQDLHAPLLRTLTLQRLHAFGVDAELLLWRDTAGWHAKLRSDSPGESNMYLDESYLLWGSETSKQDAGFMRIVEGSQGIEQVVPISAAPEEQLRAQLSVRHYLKTDPETGIVRISATRLVELCSPKGAN